MKIPKLTGLFLATTLCASVITGCGQASADEMLVPPKASIEAGAIQNKLDSKYKDITLIRPDSTEDLEMINFKDLDGDGKDEAVVFFRDNSDQSLKGVVMKGQGDSFEIFEGMDGIGKNIEKVNFDDIDNDKKQEIYISWQPESSYDVGFGVYGFDGKNIKNIHEGSPRAWFLGDLDNDGINELYEYNEERENMDNPNTRLERLELKDGKMKITDTCKIQDFAYGPQSVTFGKAKDETTGLFMDIADGNAAFTDLIVLEDGKMKNVFYDNEKGFNEKTFKSGPTPSYDIDGDGITEISIPKISKGYEDSSMASIVWVTEWFKWDGKDGLAHVMDTYDNYPMDMRFVMDEGWKENVKIEVNPYDSEETFAKFFYEDENNKDLLFEVQYVSPEDGDRFESQGYEKLRIGNNKIYYIRINESLESQKAYKFKLSIDEIRKRTSSFRTNSIF